MENEEVIVLEAKTNPEAFGRLYDMYYQPIFAFVLSRIGNVEVSKDICSETFFQALKNISKYKPKGRPFKSWLFAIAVAQVGNYYRKRSKMLAITIDECPELVAADIYQPDFSAIEDETELEIKEQVVQLRRLMGQLNQKQQTILTLRYFSHMTIPEISQVIKMKEGTIKSHLHRALKKLHVLMTEEDLKNEYDSAGATQSRTAFGVSGV
ncbi:sigma-70 family RNA polymerase sigma factor [Patescibacteria group bacterium]|nr:sigma-70 family RNA polymerase sigma factor [Patescibacteria group bacterium]MBU1705205.1 sigma-70 family RNA polymerase sigma factor [Patescibacteria group bacterium]